MAKVPLANTSFESVVREVSKQEKGNYNIGKIYPAFIVLIVMFGISFFIFKSLQENVAGENDEQFDSAVNSVMRRLENHQDNLDMVVNSVSGVYDLVVEVVSDFFMLYTTVPASNYESIQSMNYIPKVPAEEIPIYNYLTQSEGYYTYRVFPIDTTKQSYYPVKHIIPIESNRHKQGLDLSTYSPIKNKIDAIIKSNEIGATSFFNIRPDTLGFYLLKAVYAKDSARTTPAERKKNFKGMVGMEVVAANYFKEALRGDKNSKEAFPTDETIIFEIIEENDGQSRSIYKSSNFKSKEENFIPYAERTVSFEIADRRLTVDFITVPDFGGKLKNNMPMLVLLISVVLSIAFFLFVLSMLTAKTRAQDLAERMTRSQRRIVDSSEDVIGVLDFNGKWKSVNSAAEKIFGVSEAELLDSDFTALLFTPEHVDKFNAIRKSDRSDTEDEYKVSLDLKMRNKAGELVWMSWNFAISSRDKLVYSIGRDVTLQKHAQAQARIRTKQTELAEQFTRESSESKSLFMMKLSHHLRNSLTSITGYLQMLEAGVYENEDEMNEYITEITNGTNELFYYTENIVDGAIQSEEQTMNPVIVHFDTVLTTVKEEIRNINPNIEIQLNEEEPVNVLADKDILASLLIRIIRNLVLNVEKGEVAINGVVNVFENAAEIQIMGPPSELVDEYINIYKEAKKGVINILEKDREDILYTFALAASEVRRLNGSILIESFGAEDGSLVQLTLPINENMS